MRHRDATHSMPIRAQLIGRCAAWWRWFACVLATTLLGCASAPGFSGPALDLANARGAYGRAWNQPDSLALANTWMSNFVFVGDQGVPYARDELIAQLGRGLGKERLMFWQWTPRTIHVYMPWKIAVESGDYSRTLVSSDGTVAKRITGTYTAQWYRAPMGWQLQVEVQSPTACDGPAALCGAR